MSFLKESKFVNDTISALKKSGHSKTAIEMVKDGLQTKGSQSRKDLARMIRNWRNHTESFREYRFKIEKMIKELDRKLQVETNPQERELLKNQIFKLQSNIYVNGAAPTTAKATFKQGLDNYITQKSPDILGSNWETKVVKQPANRVVNRFRHFIGLDPKLVDKTVVVPKKQITPYSFGAHRALRDIYI